MEQSVLLALDALNARIAILDDNGTILTLNRAWRSTSDAACQLLGNVQEGINYLKHCETGDSEGAGDAAAFATAIRGVMNGDTASFSLEYSCQVGTELRWFIGRTTRYIDKGEVRIIVIHVDITERVRVKELLDEKTRSDIEQKRVIERLKGLQAVTAALSEALTPSQVADVIITQGAAVLGGLSGTVALLNDEGAMLGIVAATGYTAQETAVLDPWRIFPANIPAPVAEVSQTGQPIWLENRAMWVEQYPHLAAELEKVPHHAWAMVPLVADGRMLGTLGFAFGEPRVFSEDEKNFILTLAQQCAQAIQRAVLFDREKQARIDAESAVTVRENFLSIAAHELRTPLTSIYGNIQLLDRYMTRNDESSRDKEKRLVAQTIQQTRRFNRMIEELLDITRLVRGQLIIDCVPLDLIALVRRVVYELRPHLTNHTIECVLPATPLIIDGDEFRLEQVLQNLLQNAIKYSPKGGQITVQAEQRGNSACVAIRDEGIGIPAEAISKLFKRFYRAENVGAGIGGLGIGLYLVHELVSLHGGRVEVDSTEGEGSTFTVCIPLLRER